VNTEYLIVGFDPGASIGLACLDLDGKIVKILSRKMSLSESMKEIRDIGIPIVFATDKARVPSAVKKIASKYNCLVISPPEDLGVLEKRRLVNEFSHEIKTKSTHEMDALSSALFAFKKISKTIKKVDSKADGLAEIKKRLILGEIRNIKAGVEKEIEKKAVKKRGKKENIIIKIVTDREGLKQLKERIEELEESVIRLKFGNLRDRRIRLLEEDVKKLRRENEILKTGAEKKYEKKKITGAKIERLVENYQRKRISKGH